MRELEEVERKEGERWEEEDRRPPESEQWEQKAGRGRRRSKSKVEEDQREKKLRFSKQSNRRFDCVKEACMLFMVEDFSDL